ncbi:hypothetical protein BST11_24200 [Mycobacterium alsense]|uniref:PPE family protein n=1 Tax=Mycobacterium alsense TaxID=324058 RepID=A0AA42BXR7_9MYCO|nr:PPE family protein [Mycobacterium alsense]MCV7377858.1 PPE family protein [Mycobacterium alsense]OQZ88143.1 hypothetical protein BST11_24200 [Mycobacterium alsense]
MTPPPFTTTTVLTDFGLLPPEINSGRLYSGAGSAPLMAAAAAWEALAAELRSMALAHGAVISELTARWHGSSAASMAAAAAPYAGWVSATAARAEEAAAQARAAAASYETALAATVPPLVIAANRVRLMSLVAANVLGQNTAAIAATEAGYAEMWAQDAVAMYGYATESAAAALVTPFTPPPRIADPAAYALQALASGEAPGPSAATTTETGLSQLLSAVPAALQGLASPTGPAAAVMAEAGLDGADFSTPAGILNFLAGTDGSPLSAFLNDNLLNTMFSSGFYMPGNFLGTMTDFVGLGGGDAAAAADAGGGVAQAAAVGAAGSAGFGGAVSAGVGQASSVGALSVPYGWTTAAPEIRLAAEALPSVGVAPAVGSEGSLLGEMALASMAARSMSGVGAGPSPMGVTASENRPLPIVIVRPPQSTIDHSG